MQNMLLGLGFLLFAISLYVFFMTMFSKKLTEEKKANQTVGAAAFMAMTLGFLRIIHGPTDIQGWGITGGGLLCLLYAVYKMRNKS